MCANLIFALSLLDLVVAVAFGLGLVDRNDNRHARLELLHANRALFAILQNVNHLEPQSYSFVPNQISLTHTFLPSSLPLSLPPSPPLSLSLSLSPSSWLFA